MKRCPDCNTIFENSVDVCPSCGVTLENYVMPTPHTSSNVQTHITRATDSTANYQPTGSTYEFERIEGRNIVINGAVAEMTTQQYYQSRFTKFVRAVFSGEPYQLSHTSFVTIFRVEEHTVGSYPEQAHDIVLYGSLQNVFAVGDDVTITARRHGNRLVARNVYNHSIDSQVRIQPNIPAAVIRLLAIIIAVTLVVLLYSICTADFAALGTWLKSLIGALLPVALVVWGLWKCFKGLLGRK